MDGIATQTCTICGDHRSAKDLWFLVAENRWEDKLKVLHWNDRLARQRGVMRACGAAHVQELVVHWMTTGSLDYPFARFVSGSNLYPARGRDCAGQDIDTENVRQIGEISVDRESLERVLTESPQSLRAILDALIAALHRESAPARTRIEWENDLLALARQS